MTTSIVSVDSTTSKIQVGGVDAFTFNSTGITVGAGKRLAQIQTFQTGAVATGTTLIPNDNTIPQNTEGDQYLSLAFTPQSAASTLEIEIALFLSSSIANAWLTASLFQDSAVNAIAAITSISGVATSGAIVYFKHVVVAGSVATTTFKVRAGLNTAGTMTLNGSGGSQYFGGVSSSRITIKEYLP